MAESYSTENITDRSVLTEEEKRAFDKEFAETSASQASYEEIVTKLMKSKGIDAVEAAALTGLNENLFKNLSKPGGTIQKRFVVSIGVGFQLDVHLTEYILESCGMRFCESSRLDKAYIYVLQNCKGKGIDECNGVLRDLGIEGKDMLGSLTRNDGKYKKRTK